MAPRSACRRCRGSCPGCVTGGRSSTYWSPDEAPSAETLEARLAAVISFYRWQEAVYGVRVAGRLMRGVPRRIPARGLLAHLDARSARARRRWFGCAATAAVAGRRC